MNVKSTKLTDISHPVGTDWFACVFKLPLSMINSYIWQTRNCKSVLKAVTHANLHQKISMSRLLDKFRPLNAFPPPSPAIHHSCYNWLSRPV